ncbi:MAG: 30S ribosomal protein S4, partial [Chloroflexi bacterium]|nr:30S ribosomal protein S4 [Chloroflexota bacterium]
GLDNVVYRLGIAESRAQARQLVNHGHISLNERKASVPSIETRIGDKIGWTERGRKSKFYEMARTWQGSREVPGWLRIDPIQLEGELTAVPAREDIDMRVDENAIVEYYSR